MVSGFGVQDFVCLPGGGARRVKRAAIRTGRMLNQPHVPSSEVAVPSKRRRRGHTKATLSATMDHQVRIVPPHMAHGFPARGIVNLPEGKGTSSDLE